MIISCFFIGLLGFSDGALGSGRPSARFGQRRGEQRCWVHKAATTSLPSIGSTCELRTPLRARSPRAPPHRPSQGLPLKSSSKDEAKGTAGTGQSDLFKARLYQIIDVGHPRVRLESIGSFSKASSGRFIRRVQAVHPCRRG
jgi:hypothetical protein